MLNFLQREGRNQRSNAAVRSTSEQSPAGREMAGNESKPRFDPIKFAQANPWLVEGQADDRLPVNGVVPASDGSPAEKRSLARRTHQLMFKKWSQARHD